jgi:hypothetical protein
MIIFNTTYCLDHSVVKTGLIWLKESYIPKALDSGQIHTPRLSKILSDETDGINYSLQFLVESIEVLEVWYQSTGDLLHQDMVSIFGDKMLGFSTLLEEVELA